MAGPAKLPCARGVALATQSIGPPCASPGWVLAASIMGSGLVFADGSALGVALPYIQRDLRATGAELQWIVASYSLLLTAFLLLGGALGDRYGRRRAFAGGVALFGAASMLSAWSPSTPVLIAGRALQGLGGALLAPSSLALIAGAYPGDARGRAIGTWSAVTALAAAAGPLIAGLLVERASWRWIFWINVPVSATIVIATYARVPEWRAPDRPGRIDVLGAFVATFGLGAAAYGLIAGASERASAARAIVACGVGVLALLAFARIEARAPAPLVPPALLRVRAFRGVNLLTLFLYMAFDAVLLFLPFHFTGVERYSPFFAGAALLPLIAMLVLFSRWAGGLIPRFGVRRLLVAGPLICAAGFALLAVPGVGSDYASTFLPALLVVGMGMAVSVAPLTTAVLDAVPSEQEGIASGINNAVSETAALLAYAALGLVVLAAYARGLATELTRPDVPEALRAAVLDQSDRLLDIRLPPGAEAAAATVGRAAATAFVGTFRLLAWIGAALAAAAAAVAAVTLSGRAPQGPSKVPVTSGT
ncbi:MAG TPA: MFS transporter [Haliangiales bacterium]|nr:MFS transporter [Haliangiales bacterium]